MATYTAEVVIGSDDGSDVSTSTDYIRAYYLDGFPTPTEEIGFAKITTSGVTGLGTITGATLFWWNHSYTKSRSATYNREILIWNGSSYSSIYTSTATPSTLTWDSHALTSGELAYINNYNSNTQTLFRFEVGDPGGGYNREWLTRAYEYGTDGTYNPYLEIYYTAATAPTQRRGRIFVIG